jgi:hypothetical protein
MVPTSVQAKPRRLQLFEIQGRSKNARPPLEPTGRIALRRRAGEFSAHQRADGRAVGRRKHEHPPLGLGATMRFAEIGGRRRQAFWYPAALYCACRPRLRNRRVNVRRGLDARAAGGKQEESWKCRSLTGGKHRAPRNQHRSHVSSWRTIAPAFSTLACSTSRSPSNRSVRTWLPPTQAGLRDPSTRCTTDRPSPATS